MVSCGKRTKRKEGVGEVGRKEGRKEVREVREGGREVRKVREGGWGGGGEGREVREEDKGKEASGKRRY